ncbi:hypothetical protein M9H77_35871 [Catharanthus roseus]|uniref:Uncharacterized protein n=1 Tax=Catharanthus roseus TaxID=4058 RepID=A0ACB9ZQ78_CATRO|nr:hypothetical protein M9H77_35871 [Catharanthus roseus]
MGYGNFSPHARSYEHNSYDCYEGNRLELQMVIMIELIIEFQGMVLEMKGTIYNTLKLPLFLRDAFGSYDYVAWEQKLESLFCSYGVREEKKFQLMLKSLSYEVNVWWDCKYENKKRMEVQPIKTWSLMKQALRMKFGVENHGGQRQGQAKEKFMESLIGEKSTKANELSQAYHILDRKVIHNVKKNNCTFVKEEK